MWSPLRSQHFVAQAMAAGAMAAAGPPGFVCFLDACRVLRILDQRSTGYRSIRNSSWAGPAWTNVSFLLGSGPEG